MTEENKNQNSDLDVTKLKNDILESNKGLMNDLKESILQQVQATITEHAEALRSDTAKPNDKISGEALAGFEEELEALGVDEKQGNALMKIMERFLGKKTTAVEDSILKKVDENINSKEVAKSISQETMMMFPEIKDKTSELFKMSRKLYTEMSKKAQQSPEAEVIAVERAALRLGIRPRSLTEANAWASQNPMGGDGEKKSKGKEISGDLAKFFGVDPKKVNEKLKAKGIL